MSITDRPDSFRERLRTALQLRGMPQAELARRLEVRDATVSDWLNRGSIPSGVHMLRLPELLGVDGHWLLTGEGGPELRSAAESEPIHSARREQLRVLLEVTLALLESPDSSDPHVPQTRLRRVTEGEARALEAVVEHYRRTAGPKSRAS